ncbi:hypothetical protein PR048_020929 [Dryococelus australis]|uniref:Uncharacterized protein n=1 Tax=Dryococelus australis TaxID=614101 RepID=A0ABQ9GWT2_9NEOP|nr:hypothetical protein PR048_020929 [Dryococelus australis]
MSLVTRSGSDPEQYSHQNFGTGKHMKDRIGPPNEYNGMTSTAITAGFASENIPHFKNTLANFLKRTTKSVEKTSTSMISKYRHFKYK